MRPPYGPLAVPAPPRPRGFGPPLTQNLPVPRPVQAPEQKQGFMERLMGTDPNLSRILGKDATTGARNQALLALGGSLLESSGPSPVRVGTGQALGRGIQAGMGAYQSALQGSMSQHQAGEFLKTQQAEQERQQRVQGLLSPENARNMGLTDSQIQLLRGMTPDKALEVLSSQAFAGPAEMDVQTVDVGDQRVFYDTKTGREIRREPINEKYEAPADVQRVGAFLGLNPDSTKWTPEQQEEALGLYRQLEIEGRPQGTTVNVNPNAGNVQQRALEAASIAVATDRPAVLESRTSLDRIKRMEYLLANEDPYTGTWATRQASLDQAAARLGLVDPGRANATQELSRGMKNEVMNLMSKFTGVVSDADIKFMLALSGDADLNRDQIVRILEISKQLNQHAVDEHDRRVDALRNGQENPDGLWDIMRVGPTQRQGGEIDEYERAFQEWQRSQGGF